MGRGGLEFVGLSGCGKSTLGKRVAASIGIPFLDFADLLLGADGHENLDHDLILTWDAGRLDRCVRQVQRELAARAHAGQMYVLETHICPNNPGEGYRPTPPAALEMRCTRGMVAVLPSFEDLVSLRHARGAGRDAFDYTREQFAIDTGATLAASIALASAISVACYVCRNPFGSLEATIRELDPIARRMLSV